MQSQNDIACLQAMRMAQDDKSFPTEVPLYVCFNPYFPDKADLSCERRRLEGKLKVGSGLVRGIYLQVACPAHDIELCPHFLCLHTSPAAFLAQDSSAESTWMNVSCCLVLMSGVLLQMGSDLQRLEEGLLFLNKAAGSPGSRSSSRDVQLFGSIFLPTKRYLSPLHRMCLLRKPTEMPASTLVCGIHLRSAGELRQSYWVCMQAPSTDEVQALERCLPE